MLGPQFPGGNLNRKFLLSIDGGGIRGILPAAALLRLERLTGKPAREVFSFVAGTSTGALMAAAIAAGVPAAQILDIYLKRGREIFRPRKPWNEIKRVATGSMYDTRKIYEVLAQEFGSAQAWSVNDSPIDILLTAKAVADGAPWYFVKDRPANSQVTGRFGLVDCATASAAAPTYFEPWTMRDRSGTTNPGLLVDGGVGVTGNPVYQACVEAFCYTGEYLPEQTTIVSLGTGKFQNEPKPRSILGWLQWILNELLRSPGEQQTELVRRHFPEACLHRLNPDIRAIDPALLKAIDMDDVEAIERLRAYGEEFAATIDWEGILDGCEAATPIPQAA
jgi:uncharacterized protein